LAKALTAAACAKCLPGPARRIIRDGGARSLYLVITPAGAKSWMMRFRRPDGRPGKLVLGPLDTSGHELNDDPQIGQPLTLAAARALATKVLRERALGRDPIADHKARKHRQRSEREQAANNSFAAVARRFVEEHARPKTRRWYETSKLLGLRPDDLEPVPGGLAQRWAARPVASIDGHDIWSVIDEAHRVGVPGTTARTPGLSDIRPRTLWAALSSMFSWAHRHRLVEVNHCAGVPVPPAPQPRERTLTADEIRWFWEACGDIGEPFGSIFKLLLLTGARLNEVGGMRRDELSEDGATWSLPGRRTKNGRPYTVPLPAAAQTLVGSALGEQQIVFSTTGATPPSGWSRAKRRLDDIMLSIARKERGRDAAIPPWRLHDLRRTCATGMAEIGIAPHQVSLRRKQMARKRARGVCSPSRI
jgi:integrase